MGSGGGNTVTSPMTPYAGTTDATGKFRIENVEPGKYFLMAERTGFVRQQYGARKNSMPGTLLTLTAGHEMKSIDFKLVPQGVITGRVLDEDGDPLPRATVQVMMKRYNRGKQQLMPSGGAMTNDTGEFRIADLSAGRYFLSATYHRMGFGGPDVPTRNPADKPEEDYVTTYYPASLDQTGASPVELEAGQEMPRIDIRMRKARVFRIRGKIAAQPGEPTNNIRLMLVASENSFFFNAANPAVRPDGTFEMSSVQPGSYFVIAMRNGGVQGMVGKVAVNVGQQNVDGIVVPILNGVTLTGSVRIDATKDELAQAQTQGSASLRSTRVQLMPIEGVSFSSTNATVKEDGSFVIENVGPDKYRITTFGVGGTYLKSIRMGGQEVLDTGIDMSNGAPGAIEVVLGLGGGQIDGVVQDAEQKPVSSSLVTLVPEPFKPNRNDLYRTTMTDQTGHFTVKGMPPGEYRLYAWEDVEPGAYTDPEYLKVHESKAAKVTVKEKSQEQVSLVQIPAEK